MRTLFREYYTRAELLLPPDFQLREFAFQLFGSSTYVRHKSFISESELRSYLVQHTPLHAYFSAARYLDPARTSMEEKGRIGTDLVFDIDADHIPGCEEEAVIYYLCPECGAAYTEPVDKCQHCGAKPIKQVFVSEKCIQQAAHQALMLVDVIREDLGHKNMTITFSGHRGFHIHVMLPDDVAKMGSEARREILQYLLGEGVLLEDLVVTHVKRRRRIYVRPPPRIVEGGWRRRIAKYLASHLRERDIALFVEGRPHAIDPSRLVAHAEAINKLIEEAVNAMRIYVDEKVLLDLSRLVRIPGSLNGKAGLLVKPLSPNELQDFVLDESLSPFAGLTLRVRAKISIGPLEVLGEVVRLRRGELMKVDGARGVFLALKGLVEVVEVD